MANGSDIILPTDIKRSSAQIFDNQPLMFEEARTNSLHAAPEIYIHTKKDGSAHGLPIACVEFRCKDSNGNDFRATWLGTTRMLKQVVAALRDS